MYGKHFGSMYEGSMVGAGSHIFAVMGYVIAKQVPDRAVGSQVRLNPELLALILGDTPKRMQEAIDYLCAPDPKSNTPTSEGRRLVKIGAFDYQVVNGAKYRAIRDEEARRASNREAKRRERAKKVRGGPLPGEHSHAMAEETGDQRAADNVVTGALPVSAQLPQDPASIAFREKMAQDVPTLAKVLGVKPKIPEI